LCLDRLPMLCLSCDPDKNSVGQTLYASMQVDSPHAEEPLLGGAADQQPDGRPSAALAEYVVPAAVVALGLVVSGMALVPLLGSFGRSFRI